MKLQEELSQNFNKHKIVVNVLYGHIKNAALLKSLYNVHITTMIQRMEVAEKLAQHVMTKATKWEAIPWEIGVQVIGCLKDVSESALQERLSEDIPPNHDQRIQRNLGKIE